ncbi:MAG: hypothetical protein EOP24_43785 [Hyphomicrobiales bacterium]|nr:MAG: hypothetical protein EOP24_43785 [Hyphomicrobiales bacterium]
MLISPPFLSLREIPVYDEQSVNNVMPGGVVGSGAFPVSMAMGWHGGLHLHAPKADEPVRAIADGVVIYRRDPETVSYAGKDHSTGCVVIRHKTDIGADGNTPVEVTFYSITLHLSQLHANLPAVGKPIYRKDKIGTAGKIRGEDNLIHFEIIAGDADLKKLLGRSTGRLDIANDGRSSVVYGEMYISLPSGAPCYQGANPPVAQAGSALPPASTFTTEDLIVGLNHESGNAVVTTYKLAGDLIGSLTELEAEYNLYTEATKRQAAASVGSSPSGWYELLRFGRNLGPDPLSAGVLHWRKIKLPSGSDGWVNLNAGNTKKFSDGDFPHFRGWRLVDDDSTDNDSRCQSAMIERILNITPEGEEVAADTPGARLGRLCAEQPRLAKTICKFPTEWVEADLDDRWKWVKEKNPYNPNPLNEDDFKKLKEYAAKLCFWDKLPGEDTARLTKKHWHFHPREFIIHFRKCGWLSEKELKRMYPAASAANVVRYLVPTNKTIRKYSIYRPQRMAHLFGQAAVESNQFMWMSELFNGDPYNYFRNYEKAKNFAGWLGNIEQDDGGKFRGRGFKQLTGRANYAAYWVYKGWLQENSFLPNWWRNTGWWGLMGNAVSPNAFSTLPINNQQAVAALKLQMRPPEIGNPDLVSSDSDASIDTAGWFWAKNNLLQIADQDDVAQMTRKIRGDGPAIGVTQPWPAAAHYPERLAHTNRIKGVLGDT